MQTFLNLLKKILPEEFVKRIRPVGHGFLAYLGAVIYGFPSRKLIVVGITGTAGKSTTTRFLASILNAAGKKTGYITTVNFFDGRNDVLNKHGMSMPGRFLLQKELKQMLQNDCKYAIIECTSEGLAQNRHAGIDFDLAVVTNLAEAHLDSHGGFENYKKAKGKLFAALEQSYVKPFFKTKVILVNAADANKEYFLSFKADQKIEINLDREVKINLVGDFNKNNAIMAMSIAEALGVTDLEIHKNALAAVSEIPGRMQSIANDKGLKIFLDYAPEPVAMENVLKAISLIEHKKIIHVFGSTGGHRDVAKRFEFGKISAAYSDKIIITNDDVYDSDPVKIVEDIMSGIKQSEHKKVSEIIVILDRKDAIKRALQIAQSNDIVLITGKGSEQFLILPGNQRIEWDEKKVIEQAL
ncbi:MAG: UDP-N-acetylmuramyl tripeptide synthetase [Candidatus Doudnabacteria bacterium]|nr:UDP-N-acetylmuramyl tripeptide synthetase [Candidatus Doudnabacteria bacterium]